MALRTQGGLFRRLLAMLIVAAALGYIEAALVVYLRQVSAPVRQRYHPDSVGELVPLLTLEQLESAGEGVLALLTVELCREPAPLILLLAAAWGLRRRRRDTLGFFLVGFGVWDIFYYAFLKVLLDWPASLGTWDILYLIPTAWVAPVWAPLAVAATMAAIGMVILLRRGVATAPAARPRRARRSYGGWLALIAGVGLVLGSFFLHTREAFTAVPARYDWWWFALGWGLAVAGVTRLLWPGR
jgi:hypothetical protein